MATELLRMEGTIMRDGAWYMAEVGALDVASQGTSKQGAVFAVADAIVALINMENFKIACGIVAEGGDRFWIEADKQELLRLRYERQNSGSESDHTA